MGKIRLFGPTSLAVYAWYRLMEQLELPKPIVNIHPNELGWERPRVVIDNRLPREPFVTATFDWEPNPMANPPVPGLVRVVLSGTTDAANMPVADMWHREFKIEFPDDPEIPEFRPTVVNPEWWYFRLPSDERNIRRRLWLKTGVADMRD